jgi:hypothetical protein
VKHGRSCSSASHALGPGGAGWRVISHDCMCSCHAAGPQHAIPCCYGCKYCGRRVAILTVDAHELVCHTRPLAYLPVVAATVEAR